MTAREIYDFKIANNICPRCNGVNDSDRVYCKACRDKDAKERKIVIAMREAMGVCTKCGKNDADDGSKLCKECRTKIKAESVELREWRKEKNLCPRCGKNALVGNEKTCIECRAYNASRWREWMAKNPQKGNKEKNREFKRIEYKARKDAGLCTKCKRPMGKDTHAMCARCREKDNEARRKRNYAKVAENKKRIENGGCMFCNNKALPGKKVCEEHYNRLLSLSNNKSALEYRQRIKKQTRREIEARKGAV